MRKYIIIVVLTLSTCVLYSQGWQPCGLTDNSFLKTIGTSVVVHNGKIFEFHRNGIVNTLNVSTDDGATWTVVNSDWMTANSNSLGYNNATLASVGNRLYLFAGGACGEVLYSTDEGATFQLTDMTNLPTCVTNPKAKAALFYPNMWATWGNDNLIAIFESAQASRIYNISNDQWGNVSGIIGNAPRGYCSRNDTLWASSEGTTHTGAMWSLDATNWNFTTGTGLDKWEYPNLIKWNNNRLFMYTNHYQKGDRLRYSDDYGETFQEIDLTPYFFDKSTINKVKDIFSCNGNLYISLATFWPPASSPNLLVSTDNGQTFIADTLGFPIDDKGKFLEINYNALVYNNGWLFAQFKNGDLYRKYIGQASDVSYSDQSLSMEVFPNPANNILNIKAKEEVNIKIVNLLGITIASQKLSIGNNSIDVSTLSKGFYFIQSSNGDVMKFIKE